MFPTASFFRLDWRSEFKKLGPFMKGRGGVIRINFASEDAAPAKFSHILKEDFGVPGNGTWLSIRVDDKWSTTYTVDDQIDAFAKKLAEGGVAVDFGIQQAKFGDFLSGNSVDGNMDVHAPGLTLVNGFDGSAYAVRKRIEAVIDGVRRLVECGGHLMVVINDMASDEQGQFWRKFWEAGLAEAGGANLLLVYFVGPKCNGEPHPDAPAPNLLLTLPSAIEGDESRENDVYDDIIEFFEKAGFLPDQVSIAADGIISGHGHSVLAVQEALGKLVLRMKQKPIGGDC